MTSRLFHTYVIVDWSARAAPSPAKPAKDAIWIGVARAGTNEVATHYMRTRRAAEAWLLTLIEGEVAAGRRCLVGFDFPFGYPAGVAEKVTGEASALSLWRWLAEHVRDGDDNANNRFEVAARINRLYDDAGPFWGAPHGIDLADVPARARDRSGMDHPPERRACDRTAKGAKTVWQLMYAGAVGSQTLLGLPALHRLRNALGSDVQVWPFDSGLSTPEALVVLAEIYPSLFATPADAEAREIPDRMQVRVTAAAYRDFDEDGALAGMLDGPKVDKADRVAIAAEEAWILGLGDPALDDARARRRPRRRLAYERDPASIYAASFATVKAEATLAHLPDDLRDVAIRLVHSCGMTDVPNRLAWSADVVTSARAALSSGAPVICDCRMAAAGVIDRFLPAGNEIVVTLNDAETPALAKKIGNTRSAAAVELWRDQIDGAVVVIGNAPTALFHLLELLDQGWPRPAAILGFPVGFVGAAESKAELAARPRGAPFLTLRGRRGGSAMAAAALNAIAGGLS